MDLGNMREHGVRSVAAHCQKVNCGHSGSVNAAAQGVSQHPNAA